MQNGNYFLHQPNDKPVNVFLWVLEAILANY